MINPFKFIQGVKNEAFRVSWPTGKETLTGAVMVVLLAIVAAIFFLKYRPQFYFRTTDVTGEVELAKGTEMVMPGDDAKFTVKLITPIAMNDKLNFAIREGGKTVGAGVVTKILE